VEELEVGNTFSRLVTGTRCRVLLYEELTWPISLQLFDTASVVEYYESFAKHAFESTSTSVTLQCVVLGPDGRPVPCAFCFSVRRDLFSVSFTLFSFSVFEVIRSFTSSNSALT